MPHWLIVLIVVVAIGVAIGAFTDCAERLMEQKRDLFLAWPLWLRVPIGLVGIWALITLAVYCVEVSMTSENTKQEFHFIFQLLTGNWSVPPYISPKPLKVPFQIIPFRMAASLSFAFVINLATLGLFAWLFKRIRDLQKGVNAMAPVLDLATALAIKDQTAKDFLTEIFSRQMPPKEADAKIAEAFGGVDAEWKGRLEFTIGKDRASKVFELLRQTL